MMTSTCPTTMTGYPSLMDKYAKFDYYSPMNTTGYYPGMPTTTPVTPFGKVTPCMPEMTGYYGYPSTFGSFPSTWNNVYPTSSFGNMFPSTWNNWTGSFGYPTTFGSNTWTNTWGKPEFYNNWFNTPVQHEKLCNIAFRPASEIALYTLTNPIRVLDNEGNRQLYLCFELKSFKPEEITVTLNKAERAVVIEAAHDVKEGKEHAISRKYSRKFVLPESLSKVDLTKVELKSFLNPEGYLIVEAQLPKMTAEEIAKCPISSELFNKMPFYGYNTFNTFGGVNSNTYSQLVNNVKPVTVKTA